MLKCHGLLRRGLPSLPLAVERFYGAHFSVSPRAWRRIVEKNREDGVANDARFLRLAIDSGGCHGYLYKFSLEPMDALKGPSQDEGGEDLLLKETDVVRREDPNWTRADPPPQVVVDALSVGKLQKAVIDYHSELKGAAFVVVGNDLVDQSCACALSFSLKAKTKPTKKTPTDAPKTPAGGKNSSRQEEHDDARESAEMNPPKHRPVQRSSLLKH